MSRHTKWGIVAAILSLALVSTLLISLSVKSTHAPLVTDDFFPFTSSAGPIADTNDRMMYEETDPYATVYPSNQEDYTLTASAPDLYFYTDQYPSTGSETVFESTWTVKIYVSATSPGNKFYTSIGLASGDPPSTDNETPQISMTASSAGEYTITGFDFTGFPSGSNNLANRRLFVRFSRLKNDVTLRYGDETSYWMGLTTGTVVPENLLGFLFLAPFIPITAKAFVRWLKREKLLATHEGERRGKR